MSVFISAYEYNVARMQDRIISITTDLVAIPSHETEAAAQGKLIELLEPLGFECRLQEIAPDRPNLIATRGTGGPFICSHIDTHPPHSHPDPYTVKRQGDVLVGRGVVDTKGLIAALIAALETERDAPATVVICCDEEFTGLGSQLLELRDEERPSGGGVVLEPTDFRICTAQTGHIDLHVEASAPSTHTYALDPGISPIECVLAARDALQDALALQATHPLLPSPRLHLGVIHGGEHLWRSPHRARAEMAIGLLPGVDIETATNDIKHRLDAVLDAWRHSGVSCLYDIVDASDAIEVPDDLPVAQRLADALGVVLTPAGMPSWTDAANLLLRHDIPCVVFGAGQLDSAHSNHETVLVSDLVRLAAVLQAFLKSSVIPE